MGKEYRKQVEVMSTIKIPTLALLEDEFDPTLFKWDAKGTAGSAVIRDATKAFNGLASMKCSTRAAGEVDGDVAYGQKNILTTNKRYVNMSFAVLLDSTASREAMMYFEIYFYDDFGCGYAGIKIDDVNYKLYYKDSAGNWVELAGYTAMRMRDVWYRFEIQFDRIERTYKHILIGASEPNVKNIKFENDPLVVGYSYILLKLGVIQNNAAAGNPAIAYFDDIVIMSPDQ